ncbi:hypothetical protein CQ476_05 [TM7 phage DolZOral124_53_65]|nr:hypothetical protein CQ476_05 [TM7 phage DolZOral124_53_65]
MNTEANQVTDAEQQLKEQLLAGAQQKQKADSLREKLRDMFRPNDFVTIANPFDHPTGWVFVSPDEEQIEFLNKDTKRVTHGQPHVRVLKVGEEIVIHGWEAYIALGRMFKEYAQEQETNMTIILVSQVEIDNFIKKAYKGIFDPNAAQSAPAQAQSPAQKVPAAVYNPPVVPLSGKGEDDPLGLTPPSDAADDDTGDTTGDVIDRSPTTQE